MKNSVQRIAVAITSLMLAACAGHHVSPPNDYSNSDRSNVIRVAFDQKGNVYPKSSPFFELPKPVYSRIGNAFVIANKVANYDPEAIYSTFEAEIKQKLSSMGQGSKVVFLIHGFNNSYEQAENNYRFIKYALKEGESYNNLLFVQVYWDGIYRGEGTLPAPIFYWFDALTYSNFAGQVGLRRLLNLLPQDTDVAIITHSRGAGVAIGAFSDPKIVSDTITAPPHQPGVDKTRIKRLRIISIAPAIGAQHLIRSPGSANVEFKDKFPKNTQILIGFNDSDPALKKKIKLIQRELGSAKYGDTRLGADEDYFEGLRRELEAKDNWLQRAPYSGYEDHGLEGYLSRTEITDCLLWAGGLLDEAPQSCRLVRRD